MRKDRYEATELPEAQFQPGSRRRVLRNLPGITLKRGMDRVEAEGRVITALAEVHTELLLIHPFRDGNGRLARILTVIMGLQAGLPPLDFGSIQGEERQKYFAAVRAGLDRNYRPMERVFEKVIERTLRAYEKPDVSRLKISH